LLACWRPLLDRGSLQQGEPYLAATARPIQVWLNADDAASIGVVEGAQVTVTGAGGSIIGPVVVGQVAAHTVVVIGDVVEQLGGDPVTVAVGGNS
jgi:NADH-quinone oxidoreductase subunit G